MRVLLDEQLPRVLRRELPDHEVRTVQEMGWRGVADALLLDIAADAGFDALLSADRGLQFQQNLRQARIGIVLLVARSNRLEQLRPLLPRASEALSAVGAGEMRRIEP